MSGTDLARTGWYLPSVSVRVRPSTATSATRPAIVWFRYGTASVVGSCHIAKTSVPPLFGPAEAVGVPETPGPVAGWLHAATRSVMAANKLKRRPTSNLPAAGCAWRAAVDILLSSSSIAAERGF